jgi:cell division protein FtsB
MLAKLSEIKTKDLHELIKRFSDVRVMGLIAFGIVVLLISWSSLKALQINYDLEKQKADIDQKIQVQKLENENLRLQNVYFQSDEYIELTARRQLNKAAPGENLYQIPRSVAMAHTVNLPKTKKQLEQEKKQHKSKFEKNLQAWHDFFFHANGG